MCVYYCVGTGNSIFLFLFGTGKIINTLSIKHQCRGNGKGFEIRVGGLLLIEIGEYGEKENRSIENSQRGCVPEVANNIQFAE